MLETLVLGAACILAYRLPWRTGRVVSAAALVVYAGLEWHYARLGHARYWQEVFLSAGVGGAAFAAAYLRLTVDALRDRERGMIGLLAKQAVYDEMDNTLGLDTIRLGRLAYELERARRYNHQLGVLLVRPDDFDETILRFGEEAGPAMLQATAEAISRGLRATDIPVREPPFDFALILPETGRADARVVAERIRLAVSATRLELGPGDVVNVTLSIGVAMFPHDATTNEQMLRAVQRALQGAVELGGNRTMLYSVPEEAPAGWGLKDEQHAL